MSFSFPSQMSAYVDIFSKKIQYTLLLSTLVSPVSLLQLFSSLTFNGSNTSFGIVYFSPLSSIEKPLKGTVNIIISVLNFFIENTDFLPMCHNMLNKHRRIQTIVSVLPSSDIILHLGFQLVGFLVSYIVNNSYQHASFNYLIFLQRAVINYSH